MFLNSLASDSIMWGVFLQKTANHNNKTTFAKITGSTVETRKQINSTFQTHQQEARQAALPTKFDQYRIAGVVVCINFRAKT